MTIRCKFGKNLLYLSKCKHSVELRESVYKSIKTYIDCILYIDCSICFTIVHMVAFVNLILKNMMMNEWM